METITAFSLAGTVLEFARFGMELLSDGRELYKSPQGVLSANEQLELATADLRALLVKLRSRDRPSATAENEEDKETFQHILHCTEKTAKELVGRLERLKVKGNKRRKWESVRKAVQSVWTKDEIECLTKKLKGFKDAIETRVLFSIVQTLDQESLQSSSRFDRLDEKTQLIISSLLDKSIEVKQTTEVVQEVRDQIATLIQLVSRVDMVNTDEHHRTRTKLVNKQVGDRNVKPGEVQEIIARFEMLDVSNVQEINLRHKVGEDILQILAYSAMTERYEAIVEVFSGTFEWAFKDPTTKQLKWSNFSEWLKKGSGVYWISGKAGSGKSTLMKHIFDDKRTRQYLSLWAKGNGDRIESRPPIPVCLATFFFSNSGTPEQKSQSGLLRALLYQVLSDWPDLISVVFPDMWAKRYLDLTRGDSQSLEKLDQALTLHRLTSAFQKLAQQTMLPLKLCFLIDGLDEFQGDHEELAALLKLTTASPTVKVCLSSRPWVIFEQIYGASPSLRLQDLTYHDIEHYVDSKFNSNPAFASLKASDPQAATVLRNEVLDKAEGVFLWVKTVVKSLLFGIRNQDDIGILRQRLMAMPQELEELYLYLIRLIDPVYLVWASKTFQIVRAARELCTDDSVGPAKRTEGGVPLNISTFLFAVTENIQFHIDESSKICLVEKGSLRTTHSLTKASLPAKCAAVKVHLTARCAGLLEVPRFEQKGPNSPIQFMHQTAQDFLQQDENWSQMARYTKGTTFDPHRALLMASVLEITINTSDHSLGLRAIHGMIMNVMLYAYHMNLHQVPNDTETAVLDILDQIMTKYHSSREGDEKYESVHWTDLMIYNWELDVNVAYLRLVALYGLVNYVSDKLAQLDRKSAAQIASILLHILLPRDSWSADMQPPLERSEMVSSLLRHGADPNFSRGRHPYDTDKTTPWSNMLWYITDYGYKSRVRPEFVRIMKMLVMAGADPFLNLVREGLQQDAESTVRRCVVQRFPEEGRDLLKEIAHQKGLRGATKFEQDGNGPSSPDPPYSSP